jgi:hypothetical protein
MPVGPFAYDGETLGGFTAPPAHDDHSSDPWPGGDHPPVCDFCGRVHRLRPSGYAVHGGPGGNLDVATHREDTR